MNSYKGTYLYMTSHPEVKPFLAPPGPPWRCTLLTSITKTNLPVLELHLNSIMRYDSYVLLFYLNYVCDLSMLYVLIVYTFILYITLYYVIFIIQHI